METNEVGFTTIREAKEAKVCKSSRNWKLKPILASALTDDVPLEDVFVGQLKEKKNISKAIQTISIASPGFGHLKRCSGLRLILAPVKWDDPDRSAEDELTNCRVEKNLRSSQDLRKTLDSNGFDLSMLEDELQILKVPARPPKTKQQAATCAKIWPVNFHPDPTTELIISGNVFNDQQLNQMELLMRATIEAASKEAVGNSSCNGSALILDPESGEPLAVASSRVDEHPLWHASMLAIDLIARAQGGGAWNLLGEEISASPNLDQRPISDNENSSNRGTVSKDHESTTSGSLIGRSQLDESKIGAVKVKRKFDNKTPLCYPSSLSDIRLPESIPLDVEPKLKNKSTSSTKEVAHKNCENVTSRSSNYEPTCAESVDKSRNIDQKKVGPYLCTNFWIFLLQEPCALCAMALLHSRVAKIFYGVPAPSGVLESKALLHTIPGLNHRYQVWSGILEKDCQIVLDQIKSRQMIC